MTKILLLVILTIALALRVIDIDNNPKALYGDELTLVYDAYSLFKTGHDQKGQSWPLVFSLGGGRPAGYVYATIPFVAFLGPTPLAARAVSILSGVGIVLLLYLIGKLLFSQTVGILAAIFVMISPWDLSMSRGAFETHFALLLALLGIYAFLKAKKDYRWYLPSFLGFALSVQTYPTYRLTVSLLVLFVLLWRGEYKRLFKNFFRPMVLVSLLILVLSFVLSLKLSLGRGSQDRFSNINVLNQATLTSSIIAKINFERLTDNLPAPAKTSLHNRAIELAAVIGENYWRSLFPNFLFLHGDRNPRHNPATMGEFFWADATLMLLGAAFLLRFYPRYLPLFLTWILIAPVPASLIGDPHAMRSSLLLPPLLLLSACGANFLLFSRHLKYRKLLLGIILLTFIVEAPFFIDKFYFLSPRSYARFWSYPAKQASQIALKNKGKFDMIFLSNSIESMEFAYPVYARLDPSLVISQNQEPTTLGEYKLLKYDNVYIGSLPNSRLRDFIKAYKGSVLYIGPPEEEEYVDYYATIRDKDSLPLLIIARGEGSNFADLP